MTMNAVTEAVNLGKKLANQSEAAILTEVARIVKANPISLVPLTSLLTLQGQPYHLRDHFAFEPVFKLRLPRRMVLKCARQVSKSTSLTASGVLRSAGSRLRSLYITPRYEQVRRLSTTYVRPFINHSVIRELIINEESAQGVLLRTFANQSVMHFSFAFLDVDRVRGIACDFILIDEVQDIDYDFVPIIYECMSASQFGIALYSGTPKTLDNGIEALWHDSSKGEWVTHCDCSTISTPGATSSGHWNMAAHHADLIKMIGLKTVVCSKCDKPINPRNGHWYHTDGKIHPNFHGYHVPQVIMPMHYESPDKWTELVAKRDGKGGYAKAKFLNEVLGESADHGVHLTTMTDIKKASKLNVNDLATACREISRCRVRVLGVDWGGGGEEEVSFTTAALCGLTARGVIVGCYFAMRFHTGFTHDEEARELLRIFRGAGCHYLAHDYGGSGSVRETLMIQAGLPVESIINFSYVRATARHIVHYNQPHGNEMRGYWALDKARSLVLQATCIKSEQVLLPEYESSKDITHDLLNLYEDKHDLPAGADIYLIRRKPKTTDDFAHSLNFAAMAIYHTQQLYPDLSAVQGLKLSQEQLSFAEPPNAWREHNR